MDSFKVVGNLENAKNEVLPSINPIMKRLWVATVNRSHPYDLVEDTGFKLQHNFASHTVLGSLVIWVDEIVRDVSVCVYGWEFDLRGLSWL